MVCRKIQACIMSISEKDKRYVWHPFTQMKTSENALPIVRGEGTLLFDEDGNSYIDATSFMVGKSSWACSSLFGFKSFAPNASSRAHPLCRIYS